MLYLVTQVNFRGEANAGIKTTLANIKRGYTLRAYSIHLFGLGLVLATTAAAGSQTLASPAPSPAATATPNPWVVNGFFRSYYFTRQNASNNPGAQFNFTPGAKYDSNAVNQASLNDGIDLHVDYHFANSGFYVGGTYLYANPLDGPCSVAANQAKSSKYPSPSCTAQVPPNTNPDDTLPGFTLSTAYEAYVAYKAYDVSAKVGDQLFSSPWAGPVDTRIKPAAFQGGDFIYSPSNGLVYELADMLQFEPRTSSTFISSTLLTSFPAGNNGMPANIYYPGGGAITTPGFLYGHVGYDPTAGRYSVNGYFWGVSDIVNMYWGDAKYTIVPNRWNPYVALQGGWENNTGTSYIGKIDSSLFGIQLGANVTRDIVLSGSFDETPWHYDTIALPKNVSCSNSTYQISTKGVTLPYFLPLNAGQCFTNPNGQTTIAYGGWASPYTDNYATNPVFTTSISQGMADRRAPGTSWRVAATYTSENRRLVVIAGDAWYDYGNELAAQRTTEWNLDGTYRFMPVPLNGRYKGLQFRYRYAVRTYSNTFCGASATNCPAGEAVGTTYLGGQPLFKYNRAMLEYDF
jgi:hypothetical protein